MAYCPGCSNRELVIQALTDLWRLRNATPAGLATAGLDYTIRNSPLPNMVEGGMEDLLASSPSAAVLPISPACVTVATVHTAVAPINAVARRDEATHGEDVSQREA